MTGTLARFRLERVLLMFNQIGWYLDIFSRSINFEFPSSFWGPYINVCPCFVTLLLSPCLFQISNRRIWVCFSVPTQEKRPHSDCINYRNGSRRRIGGFIRWSWILTTDSHWRSRWKDHNSIGLLLGQNCVTISAEKTNMESGKKKVALEKEHHLQSMHFGVSCLFFGVLQSFGGKKQDHKQFANFANWCRQ